MSLAATGNSSFPFFESRQQYIFYLPCLPAHDDPIDSLSRDSPTKLDREVLLALEGVDIDPVKFPSIHKWKSTMKVYSTSDMLR